MLACWEAAETTGLLGGPDSPGRVMVLAGAAASTASGSRAGRTFVPIESLSPAGPFPDSDAIAAAGERVPAPVIRPRRIPGSWSLWGDFEP